MFSRNLKEYRQVEPSSFVSRLRSGNAREVSARKSACVLVRPSVPGQVIASYTSNGNLELETAELEGKFVLTRCDQEGRPVIDAYGHMNSWQVDRETLEKKYETENMRSPDGFVRPRGGVQRFIRSDEDIMILVPWGKDGALVEQTIDAGGWLNITDPDNIYGIADIEFRETYAVCG